VIADNGYATRENEEETAEREVELIVPWKDEASREAGACKRNGFEQEFRAAAFHRNAMTLVIIGQRIHRGLRHNVFAANQLDCADVNCGNAVAETVRARGNWSEWWRARRCAGTCGA